MSTRRFASSEKSGSKSAKDTTSPPADLTAVSAPLDHTAALALCPGRLALGTEAGETYRIERPPNVTVLAAARGGGSSPPLWGAGLAVLIEAE